MCNSRYENIVNIITTANNNNWFKFDESDSGISSINNRHYSKQMSMFELATDSSSKNKRW